MESTFSFIGKEYKKLIDEKCNCGNSKCAFLNRDCEQLQDYHEIPQCSTWYGTEINYYFVEVKKGDKYGV